MKLDFHQNHRLLFGTVLAVFIGLTLIVAIGPATWVQSNNRPLPGADTLTDQQRRGLQVYVSEGCTYCHTQQVRPLPQDTARYGRASAPGDYARLAPYDLWRQTPTILGTERTGPDLSNVAARRPDATWHHLHLYQPRAVAEASVMPAFTWLYEVKQPDSSDVVIPVPDRYAPDQGKVVATDRARALVAYLLTLRQPTLPGSSSDSGSSSGPSGGSGGSIYASRCASCHQADGRGVQGVYPPLAGDPVVTADDASRHIQIVLFGLEGKTIDGTGYGAAMPAWADQLSDEDVAAVINHERTSWGNDAPTITASDVADVRARGAPDE